MKKHLRMSSISNKRTIVLSALPNPLGELRTIFSSSEGSIRRRLEQPPVLRYAGWSLETLDRAKIIRGEMIRVTNGDRKVIDLYRDGSLVFVGLADNEFLAHASPPGSYKINPVAIVELVYNFAAFYKLVLEDLKVMPREIMFRVDFKNMHLGGIKNYLIPYASGSAAQLFGTGAKEAPDNDGNRSVMATAEDFNPGHVAYELLREIYLWFGLEEEKIPYTKMESDVKVVDPEAIKNV